MGVMSGRCLKLLLLVTLLPLALRAATSLLLLGAGHAAPMRGPAGNRRSGGDASDAATTAARASASAAESVSSVHGRPYTAQTRHRRRIEAALAAFDGARRLRHVDADGGGDGWFEDEKRLAPTGSNPLHNLR